MRFTPAAMHSEISDAKNSLIDAEACRDSAGAPFDEMVAGVYAIYERRCAVRTRWTSTTCSCGTVKLLKRAATSRRASSGVPARAGRRVPGHQPRAVRLLRLAGAAERDRNLCVVGDDDQSIYGWRGADVRNILDFEHDFPGAKVVKLEQNYRSTETILGVANAVIANNRGGIGKGLWSDPAQGDRSSCASSQDEHAEARYIVGEAQRWSTRALALRDRRALQDERCRGSSRTPCPQRPSHIR